jgi:Fur family ferric uptake transcriptional regulator
MVNVSFGMDDSLTLSISRSALLGMQHHYPTIVPWNPVGCSWIGGKFYSSYLLTWRVENDILVANLCNCKELRMSCGERLANELRSKGYRVTPQRAVILETIAHKNGHLCAQDIYTDARRKLPGLNLATVYRTVEVLHEAEMVDLFNDGSNPALFAMRDPQHPHGHLVCRQCQAVFDIDPGVIAQIVQSVAAETNFYVDPNHLTLFGLCAACQDEG